MILFKTLRYKNILSTGNAFTEINLNLFSTTLIIGENGAGKSTLLDAIAFVLYGKAFRKINKPQLVNSINQKDLLIEVEFSNGHSDFLIRRGMKPNIFEIFQNGILVNQTAAAKDYQTFLEKDILKMNFKSFSQIIVLGSATFVPFMQLTPASRREVIEDLLDMQIFTVMNTLLKEKNNKLKTNSIENEYQTNWNIEKLELQRKHKAKLNANTNDLINQKQLQIQSYFDKIEGWNTEIELLNKQNIILSDEMITYRTSESKQVETVNVFNKLKLKKKKLNAELKFYDEYDTCPTCRQTLDQSFKEEINKKLYDSLNTVETSLPQLEEKIKILDNKIEIYQKLMSNINKNSATISTLQSNIKNYTTFIEQLEEEKKQLVLKKEDITELNDNISLIKGNLSNLEEERKVILETQKIYKLALDLLKDTGIKSLIIKQYVPVINKLVNHYLQQFDFFVQFELDETFNEKIKSRFRDEFSYDSFSEGEKKRIDLALMLTWRAIAKLRNSVSTNLLIMDEVFDGSMDSDGVENLINMIRTVCKDDNLFVISHNKTAMLDKFDTVLSFKKQGNFSRILIE